MPAPLRCPRCSLEAGGFAGCPRCRADGVPVNLVPPLLDLRGRDLAAFPGGPWGWPSLPGPPLTLGEGDTPLVPVGDSLWVKDESRNPTGSHKDRAMAVGVAAALAQGADTVVAASSGNAGASAAAYAARAGLRCVVLTTVRIPGVLAEQTRALGAPVVPFTDTAARDTMIEAAVRELGWYPLTNYVQPAAGGNAYGNEGYKSIAYELARDLGSTVDTVVVPTSRADLLAGVERGYRELAAAGLVTSVPRMVAAETATAAAFSAALRHDDRVVQELTTVHSVPSPAFSIGSTQPAWQGLQALWNTSGEAVALEVDDYLTEHRRLPLTTGLFLEASSAVAVAVARRLLDQGARNVVALGTGSGLKGLDAPAELPESPSSLDELAGYCAEWFATVG
ncbi:MAG TPA: pyridoxal-phosphate dependent enzyme [Actinophytocola sp.]|uniref:pyridoxal-phosphate dependent enzyme n=1 Tax=Actinophytocola sp. TaxID=1872138 RepID=UPI002E04106F|nr:pyridoxal-phosphate dependent enzyme [Actinophytocola sp.]